MHPNRGCAQPTGSNRGAGAVPSRRSVSDCDIRQDSVAVKGIVYKAVMLSANGTVLHGAMTTA
jgi:hypothetical protein